MGESDELTTAPWETGLTYHSKSKENFFPKSSQLVFFIVENSQAGARNVPRSRLSLAPLGEPPLAFEKTVKVLGAYYAQRRE